MVGDKRRIHIKKSLCIIHDDLKRRAWACLQSDGSLAYLLRTQQRMKRLEFSKSCLDFRRAVELLENMTENSSKHLTHVVLRDFVEGNHIHQELAQKKYTYLSQRFCNIKTLETDYSVIFENIFTPNPVDLKTSKGYHTRRLTKIILHCDGTKIDNLRGLTSSTWKHLRKSCPQLQVEVYFLLVMICDEKLTFSFCQTCQSQFWISDLKDSVLQRQ